MSKYKYYIFDYHTNKLGCLDFLENADDSNFIEVLDTRSFRFYFNQKYFDNLNEFLDYLKHLNFKIAEAYVENFGINPPYTIRQELCGSEICTNIEFKDLNLTFTPSRVPDWHLNRPIDKFFEKTKGSDFNIDYIVKLHNFLYNSMVIRPLHESRNYQFMITYADGKTTIAIILRSTCKNRCYLCAHCMANDEIFDSYNIPKSEILKILEDAGFEWHGRWPETDMQTVYKVINYINRNYYAFCPSVDGNFVVSDSGISYFGIIFKIKQHRNGKWYIDGDITKIISMFKMPNITELRKFIDKTLGRKFRKGLFPECDSKEEIIKLLNEIKKCPT